VGAQEKEARGPEEKAAAEGGCGFLIFSFFPLKEFPKKRSMFIA
jgi:hypothetical protein